MGFLSDSTAKIHLSCRRCGFYPWVWKIPWGRKWQPTLAFLPGESYGQRRLVGYSPYGRKDSDTTEVAGYAHACTNIHRDDPKKYLREKTCEPRIL